jgi:hypothetical protein
MALRNVQHFAAHRGALHSNNRCCIVHRDYFSPVILRMRPNAARYSSRVLPDAVQAFGKRALRVSRKFPSLLHLPSSPLNVSFDPKVNFMPLARHGVAFHPFVEPFPTEPDGPLAREARVPQGATFNGVVDVVGIHCEIFGGFSPRECRAYRFTDRACGDSLSQMGNAGIQTSEPFLFHRFLTLPGEPVQLVFDAIQSRSRFVHVLRAFLIKKDGSHRRSQDTMKTADNHRANRDGGPRP